MGRVLQALGLQEQPRPQMPSIVASAQRVDVGGPVEQRAAKKRLEQWQSLSLMYMDTVPEIGFAANFLGDLLSRVTLKIAEIDPQDPDSKPDFSDHPEANLALSSLGALEERSEIMRRQGIGLLIPGEAYLVGWDDPPEETSRWEVRGIEEVRHGSKGWEVEVEQGLWVGVDGAIHRLWNRSTRHAYRAWSPMMTLLAPCEELLALEASALAEVRSRLPAGVLIADNRLREPNPDPTKDDEMDPFSVKLLRAFTQPIKDRSSASAYVPNVTYAPHDVKPAEAVHLLQFARKTDPAFDQRVERLLRRLAQGLPLPPEVVLGIADLNHWGAWQVDEATLKAIEPWIQRACFNLTRAYLLPILNAMGAGAGKTLLIWYDAAPIIVRPDQGKVAIELTTIGAVGLRTAREANNFDDSDIPTAEELALITALKSAGRPTFEDFPTQGPPEQPDPEPEPATPPEQGEPTEPVSATGRVRVSADGQHLAEMDRDSFERMLAAAAAPKKPLGEKLAEIDRALFERLLAACDATLRRALEKAGTRIKARAQKDQATKETVRGVKASLAASVLGPGMVAALRLDDADLVSQEIEDLHKRFDMWMGRAQDQTLRAIPSLTPATREELGRSFARERERAWDHLSDSLKARAQSLLYNPSPEAPLLGEFDQTVLVQAKTVREAMGIAGGATTAEMNGALPAEIWLTANGPLTLDAIGQQSGVIEQWEWSYGPALRTQPFEPHLALDGLLFKNFDDPALENSDSFPSENHFSPGDHDGDLCVCIPVYTDKDGNII